MHSVIEDHKEYRALQGERRKIMEAREKWMSRLQRERASHEERVRAYNAEVERALLMAEDPDRVKSPGEWKPPAGNVGIFTEKLVEIDDAVRRWAGRRQPELSARVAERQRELLRGAAEAAERLRAAAVELEELRATETFVRRAADLPMPDMAPITAHDLLGPRRGGATFTRSAYESGGGDPLARFNLDDVDIEV